MNYPFIRVPVSPAAKINRNPNTAAHGALQPCGWRRPLPAILIGFIFCIVLLVVPVAAAAQSDLVVTTISPNVGAGSFLFANEPNVISITVKNNGTGSADASTLNVDVEGIAYTASVGVLASGANQTVTVTDTVSHAGNTTVAITATADSLAAIIESNETNNGMSVSLTTYNNGYKGKRFTGGSDINTQATFEGQYGVLYSAGNTAYNGGGWTEKTYNWTSTDLAIPSGATIINARLYQGYTWDQTTGGSPLWTMTFNGATVTPSATYTDRKGYGSYNYPNGLYVYNVTSRFLTAGNSLTITPQTGNNNGIYGAYMVVIYQSPTTTVKKIWINDECDDLYAGTARSTTSDEATAYANFAGVDTSGVASAQAIAILSSAGDANKSRFFFNSNEYTGFWSNYLSSPQIGFSTYNVTGALTSGANTAKIQSFDTGSGGDNMYAQTAILVVEKSGTAPVAAFSTAVTNGVAPVSATFTDASTNSPTAWKWEYRIADNGTWTEFSTVQNPTYSFTTAGTYDIRLTASNAGGSNTLTKTHVFAAGNSHDYLTTVSSGTVSGGLYVNSVSPWTTTNATMFTLPAAAVGNVQWAQVYVTTYSGNANNSYGATSVVTFDGTTLGTETLNVGSQTNGTAYPVNDHVMKVYSDYEAVYDVTDRITTASPVVIVTDTALAGYLFDGRIKGITLVVAYNDGDSDVVKYVVNHGNDWMGPKGASSSTTFGTSSLGSGWTSAELKEVAFSSTDATYTFPTSGNNITPTTLGKSSYWKYNSFNVTSALTTGPSNTFGFTAVGSSFKTTLATLTVKYPGSGSVANIGVFRNSNGVWYLSNGNGNLNKTLTFGKSGDTPVVGDWNKDGRTEIGVFRPSTGTWYLDYNGDGTVGKTVTFGKSNDTPVVGDWNKDGKTEIGVFRPSTGYWYLNYNFSSTIDKQVKFGMTGDKPVVGDFNTDGYTDIGVFRPSTGTWYATTSFSTTADKQAKFGKSTDTPVVGDWDVTGTTGIGVFRPSTGTWYLNDNFSSTIDHQAKFGKSTDTPVVGDWNKAGHTEIGVFRPSTGYWYLNYNFSTTADKEFRFGKTYDTPVVPKMNWAEQ